MGMGISPQSAELLGLALNTPTPLLLDADALNLLATQAHLRVQLQARWAQATVLTPVPAVTAVTTMPAGRASRTVALVPAVSSPRLVSVRV